MKLTGRTRHVTRRVKGEDLMVLQVEISNVYMGDGVFKDIWRDAKVEDFDLTLKTEDVTLNPPQK